MATLAEALSRQSLLDSNSDSRRPCVSEILIKGRFFLNDHRSRVEGRLLQADVHSNSAHVASPLLARQSRQDP